METLRCLIEIISTDLRRALAELVQDFTQYSKKLRYAYFLECVVKILKRW